MKYRRLTDDGDYTFGFGNNCFISDTDAVAQAIGTKMNMFKGDYWADQSEGLPFFQKIAGNSDKNTVDSLLEARILETPGVSSISSISSSIANRKYTATITVVTAYSTTVEVSV
jgi:hypothetical protein